MVDATSPPTQPQAIATPQQRVRHEWYQTDAAVTVSVFIKNAPKDKVAVHVTERALSVTVPLPTGADYSLELDLAHAVDAAASRHEVLGTKIEIVLAKRDAGLRWNALEGEDTAPATTMAHADAGANAAAPVPHAYPSSARKGPKDWDALGREVAKDDKDADGVNKMFQEIFAKATPETQRAMIKSYTESNGTCLSTDWGEVSKGKVETQPPEGMVAKTYEK